AAHGADNPFAPRHANDAYAPDHADEGEAPPVFANDPVPDIAAATLQPRIDPLPPEPIAPVPDVEASLRQLLAASERPAAQGALGSRPASPPSPRSLRSPGRDRVPVETRSDSPWVFPPQT